MRERRPGVWEIRVAAGTDPVTGRTLQRSVTFRGTAAEAEAYRVELASEYAARRSVNRVAPMMTVAELFERWLAADQPWKPSTQVGYASNARLIASDRKLASTRIVSLTVARGEILQAQARLGNADAATTLREYAYALPLTDQNVADAIDHHLDDLATSDGVDDSHWRLR